MVRHFYFTDDASQYLDAVRFYLAQGYPVRVGLDMSLLYKGMEDEMPHSEVLVGYDDAGFYYYETVCITPAPCEPGHRPAGEQGLYVSDQKLLDAVEGQAKLLYYPWRYSLSVFKAGELAQDLGPVWTRNGQSLIGGVRYGPRQGADVIEGLADKIEKQATRVDVAEIRPGLQVAVYVRRENATHLRTAFPAQPDLERAAGLFDQASGDYEAALGAIENGIAGQEEADEIAGWLRKAAAAEREAGQILLTRGAATG
jgi:hypothetical protein